jgi:hypothetical protein
MKKSNEKKSDPRDLVKIQLIPVQAGGQPTQENTVLVPRSCAEQKHSFDRKVGEMASRLGALSYEAIPEYENESSKNPTRIRLKAAAELECLTELIEIDSPN